MVKASFEKLQYSHFEFHKNESLLTRYESQNLKYFINLTGFVGQSYYCELLRYNIKSRLEGFHPKHLKLCASKAWHTVIEKNTGGKTKFN